MVAELQQWQTLVYCWTQAAELDGGFQKQQQEKVERTEASGLYHGTGLVFSKITFRLNFGFFVS